MLIDQQLELYKNYLNKTNESKRDTYVGIINRKCNVSSIIHDAANSSSTIFYQKYGESPPKIEIFGNKDCTISYVPSHLFYMTFELIKNSMRAIFEKYGDEKLPSIKIVIADTKNSNESNYIYLFKN
jgi:hypothetical protein